MGNVHKHLLHFPVPEFNCSFMEEGVKIKAFISAVRSPCSHCSQSSTGWQLKMYSQRILQWISFHVTAAFRRFEWPSTTPVYKISHAGASEDTCPDTLTNATLKLIHLFLFLQKDQFRKFVWISTISGNLQKYSEVNPYAQCLPSF